MNSNKITHSKKVESNHPEKNSYRIPSKKRINRIQLPFPPLIKAQNFLKTKNDGKLPLHPPNKFLIYRTAWVNELHKNGYLFAMRDVSTIVKEKWKAENDQVKNFYAQLANEVKEFHSQERLRNNQQLRRPYQGSKSSNVQFRIRKYEHKQNFTKLENYEQNQKHCSKDFEFNIEQIPKEILIQDPQTESLHQAPLNLYQPQTFELFKPVEFDSTSKILTMHNPKVALTPFSEPDNSQLILKSPQITEFESSFQELNTCDSSNPTEIYSFGNEIYNYLDLNYLAQENQEFSCSSDDPNTFKHINMQEDLYFT
ncbi:10394_t:CDS:1 [Ambispora gerdemannii]|uniref:10394_t:CDS:1 n=1 Tax=Ambispora gerdemannii TaxID=144530 RepID=A0A9N8VEP6_9GLOM|nr:10394_t:CDS:1 [Ambispora gerdemannii]